MPKNPTIALIRPTPARSALDQVLTDLSAEHATLIAIQAAMDASDAMDIDPLAAHARLALMRSLQRLEGVRDALDAAIVHQ
jgi:hypothetical protein